MVQPLAKEEHGRPKTTKISTWRILWLNCSEWCRTGVNSNNSWRVPQSVITILSKGKDCKFYGGFRVWYTCRLHRLFLPRTLFSHFNDSNKSKIKFLYQLLMKWFRYRFVMSNLMPTKQLDWQFKIRKLFLSLQNYSILLFHLKNMLVCQIQ